MLASALDTITNLIQSPPGQLAAGGVLAGIVWKFFERVEAVLTDQTKLEIANWLRGAKTADHMPWPDTFATVFDRAFGEKHLSWKCFRRSAIASVCMAILGLWIEMSLLSMALGESNQGGAISVLRGFIGMLGTVLQGTDIADDPYKASYDKASYMIGAFCVLFMVFACNVLPDFISLFETRLVLKLMKKTISGVRWVLLLALDGMLTVSTAILWNLMVFG